MNQETYEIIGRELTIDAGRVEAAALLLGEGATVPFIARYRKEATGALDEIAVMAIRDRLARLEELEKRREAVIKSLVERNLLTDELRHAIDATETLSALEDIYLPFRPKRRTRATIAREKGLEPLAITIFAQDSTDVTAASASFINPESGIETADDALAGARDIIAEWVNEDQEARRQLRTLFSTRGMIRSRIIPGKEEEGIKYRDYYEWEEPACSAPSHRVLAVRRGEREGFLTMRTTPPEKEALQILEELFLRGDGEAVRQVRLAVQDSYKRLLSAAMETELRLETKKRADDTAIRVFVDNLRQLLLSPPLGQKAVLAIDPGFRTGCKLTCLDRQGKLMHHETIYPLLSEKGTRDAGERVRECCRRFSIEAVAVGNGTAGRETEAFLRSLDLPQKIQIIMVNESGASVYSASTIARDEFPDQDITVRGSVSIGRRLMDPLAELVKIDPKSIGVGQYQHDVDQGELKKSLDDCVVSCVNAVGVDVNTASAPLLAYVSGLGPTLAENIIKHRNDQGPFVSRRELTQVHRLGPKAFEQAAGFLRIRSGINPLDGSAVHPESYPIVEAMAADQECSVSDLMRDETLRNRIELQKYITDRVGLPTLKDILAELAKPGRDPRQQFENIVFADGIEKIGDLEPGMKLTGVVTNITAFGAFVDIGVHQDGLVHISELADRFVTSPAKVVQVNQKVEVTVLSVDPARKRISLSMKKQTGEQPVQFDSPESYLQKKESAKSTVGGKPKKSGKKNQGFNTPFAELLHKRPTAGRSQ